MNKKQNVIIYSAAINAFFATAKRIEGKSSNACLISTIFPRGNNCSCSRSLKTK